MIRFITFSIAVLMIGVSSCKVRTISDGKPPRDGSMKKEISNPKYGPMQSEEHYRDGRLELVEGRYTNGTLAFKRYPPSGENDLDTTIWYYPSGQLYYHHVSSDDRIMHFKEYFEDGALKIESDTSISNEYYQNGTKNCTIRYSNGFVVQIERWHENGTMVERSEWRNDVRHGVRREWDSTGTQIVSERYVHGALMAR